MYILIGVNDRKNHVYICMTGILKILAPLTIDSPKILFMTEFSLQISVCVQGLTLDFEIQNTSKIGSSNNSISTFESKIIILTRN